MNTTVTFLKFVNIKDIIEKSLKQLTQISWIECVITLNDDKFSIRKSHTKYKFNESFYMLKGNHKF